MDVTSFHPYLAPNSVWSSRYLVLRFSASLWRCNPASPAPESGTSCGCTVSEEKLTSTFNVQDDLRWIERRQLTAGDQASGLDRAIKPENRYPAWTNVGSSPPTVNARIGGIAPTPLRIDDNVERWQVR